MMPAFEEKKNLEPMKFRGEPDKVEEQIKEAIKGLDDTSVETISNYTNFVDSIKKAKQDAVKKKTTTKKKKEDTEKKEEAKPSLF